MIHYKFIKEVRTLDILFSNYSWYRRWIGGTWINVTPHFAWYISIWVRGDKPLPHERLNEKEIYHDLYQSMRL